MTGCPPFISERSLPPAEGSDWSGDEGPGTPRGDRDEARGGTSLPRGCGS